MTRPDFRVLDEGGVRGMVALAATEGWNPGLSDAGCFFAADPSGFLGLFLGEAEPVAVISLVRYGSASAFLGLYICRPPYRGQGHGYRLWQAALETAEERSVGLDGVVAQQANYRKSGFDYAWRNVRYSGSAPAQSLREDRGMRHVEARPELVADYDLRHFGVERRAFLDAWLAAPGHRALAAVDGAGTVVGYGVIRPCVSGWKVGPLFAETEAVGNELLDALIAPLVGETVIIDVPEPNAIAGGMARARGWSPVFETARMYRGQAPDLPLERIYGITTFELG